MQGLESEGQVGELRPRDKILTSTFLSPVALHALDPVFNEFTFSEKVQNLAKSLDIHSDPRVLQSMIVSPHDQLSLQLLSDSKDLPST